MTRLIDIRVLRRLLRLCFLLPRKKYGRKLPTSASLETLLKTGRGELLSKSGSFREASGKGWDCESFLKIAEEKRVLIQASN